MPAGYRLVAFGPVALGAVLGGAAGELVGLRPALWLSVTALLACWAGFSLRAMRIADRFDAVWAEATT